MDIRKTVLLFLILLSYSVSYAQTQFMDAPFGGGGGFTPGWIFTNPEPLNSSLQSVGMPTVDKNGVFTTGGSGFLYIGFIPHLRIGGMGFSGKTTSTSGPDVNNFSRETQYSIGGGGFTVEYTLPFLRDIGVSVGAIIGGGGIEINMYKNRASAFWGDAFNDFHGPQPVNGDMHVTLKNNFWILTPTLNIEIPLYRRFVALRIGTGYQFTLGEKWVYDNNMEIPNAPSDLNGRSFFIQAGIYAGFFSF